MPILPEVFLDESYCNVNHLIEKMWLPSVCNILTAMSNAVILIIFCMFSICIIGAGVVYTQDKVIHDEFVQGSLQHWQATKKRLKAGDVTTTATSMQRSLSLLRLYWSKL